MFSTEEIEIIDKSHDSHFEFVRSENYDGSLQMNEYDLYKSNKEGFCMVIEQGQICLEDTLQECLNFIYKRL
jgi:hypothetical protein